MADETTRPDHATRTVETVRGLLTYAQLAPLLAERVLHTQAAIARGEFDQASPGRDLICALHSGVCSDLLPDCAGRWRTMAVVVGTHEPHPNHTMSRCASVSVNNARIVENSISGAPPKLTFSPA